MVLIACSVQSISADHTTSQGIFYDADNVNLSTTEDTKYKIYLQTILRNADGQLINITESTEMGAYVPHKITDHVFDTLMGQKEIVVIDNIKYEKVHYVFNPTLIQRTVGYYPIFSELTVKYDVEEGAYKKMNEVKKNYTINKIHYCAEFDGHGYRCIPIFQVLIPTITLEPHDTPYQQWTILRELD